MNILEQNSEDIENFIRHLSLDRGLSSNSVSSYKNDLIALSRFYPKKKLLHLTTNELREFLLSDANLATRTILRRISSYNAFYTYYKRKNDISTNPAFNLSRAKLEEKLPIVLSLQEVYNLLDVQINSPFDARNKAILELLYSSGIRISELTNLELSNVDLDDCIIRVMGKGKKERIIPLGEYAVDALANYLNNYRQMINRKNSSYVFLNNQYTKLSRQFIFMVIKKECKKKGIEKNVSPHTLRHTFATHLLKNGVDLRIIQELLGHEDLSTTQIYTHLEKVDLHNDYNFSAPR